MKWITLGLFVSTAALAQVSVERPPELAGFRAALKEARARRPMDSKALLAIKQGPIEPTLAEDLSKFDWYLPGGWSYPEKKFGVTWEDAEPTQYDFNRYLADGSELSYLLNIGKKEVSLLHKNFQLPPPTSAAIRKVGKETYFELTAYGAKELHRVVSYEKGVLILDVSYDGKPRSKTVKFRDVRIALPRMFESEGK